MLMIALLRASRNNICLPIARQYETFWTCQVAVSAGVRDVPNAELCERYEVCDERGGFLSFFFFFIEIADL